MKKYLITLGLIFGLTFTAHAATSVFNSNQIGTTSTTTGTLLFSTGTSTPAAWTTFCNVFTLGSNITCTGTSTLAASGGGSGNSAWTIVGASSEIYNATSSDKVGVGSTTPNATLSVSGTSTAGTRDLFDVASSSGQQVFTINPNGYVGIGSTTPSSPLGINTLVTDIAQFTSSAGTGRIDINNSSTNGQSVIEFQKLGRNIWQNGSDYQGINVKDWYLYSDFSGVNPLYISQAGIVSLGGSNAYSTPAITALTTGLVGISSTTPLSTLSVSGVGGTTPFTIASSTGLTQLTLLQNGNFGIASATPADTLTVNGSIVAPEIVSATSSNMTLDLTTGNDFMLRLGGATTTVNFKNGVPGQKITVDVVNNQFPVGPVTFATTTWDGGTQFTQSTTTNKSQTWVFRAVNATSSSGVIMVGYGASLGF